MDQTTADLVKASYWPDAFVIVAVFFMILYRGAFANRVKNAKSFDWSKKAAEFYPPQGEQLAGAETKPTLPAQAESNTPTGVVAEPEKIIEALQVAATGWRFERAMRVMYPAQLELLLALRNGAVFTDSEVRPYYDKLPLITQAHTNYLAFWQFLTGSELMHTDQSPAGENRFRITPIGQKFLRYRDRLLNGVYYPQENVTKPEPQ